MPEESPMFCFLQENTLEKYWASIQQNGFQDFSEEMKVEDVKDMGKTAEMVPGHLNKLIHKWQLLNFGNMQENTAENLTDLLM